jgi:hypothetical protein
LSSRRASQSHSSARSGGRLGSLLSGNISGHGSPSRPVAGGIDFEVVVGEEARYLTQWFLTCVNSRAFPSLASPSGWGQLVRRQSPANTA